jgi:hypothetical protein
VFLFPYTRQERKYGVFKYHAITLCLLYSMLDYSPRSQHVVGMMDRGDNVRRGHVLRLGWPLPGN